MTKARHEYKNMENRHSCVSIIDFDFFDLQL